MTPDQMKAVAQQMRDDCSDVALGQMTTSERAAVKAIYALADAMDKVAAQVVPEEPRRLESSNENCLLCGQIIGLETGDILTHYKNYHPRSYAAVKEQLDQ